MGALQQVPAGFEPEPVDESAGYEPPARPGPRKPNKVNPFDTLPAGFTEAESITDAPYRPPRTVGLPPEEAPYRPPRTVIPPSQQRVTEPTIRTEGGPPPAVAPPPVGLGQPAPVAPAPLRAKGGGVRSPVVPLSIEARPLQAPRQGQIVDLPTVPDIGGPFPEAPGVGGRPTLLQPGPIRNVPPGFVSRTEPGYETLPVSIPEVRRQPTAPLQAGAADLEFQAAAEQGANIYRSVAGEGTIPGKMRELITRGGFKAEEAMKTPLVDLSQFAPEDAPLIQGVAEALSSFTSPEGVLMMAGTGALGRIAKGNFGRAFSLGFTVDMLDEFPAMGAEFRQALSDQRWDDADRAIGQMLAQGGMAGLAAAHTLTGGRRYGEMPGLRARVREFSRDIGLTKPQILEAQRTITAGEEPPLQPPGGPGGPGAPRLDIEAEPIRPQPFTPFDPYKPVEPLPPRPVPGGREPLEPLGYEPRVEPEGPGLGTAMTEGRTRGVETFEWPGNVPRVTIPPSEPMIEPPGTITTGEMEGFGEETVQQMREGARPPEPTVLPEVSRRGAEAVSAAAQVRPTERPLPEVPAPIEKTWLPGAPKPKMLKPAPEYIEELVRAKEAAEGLAANAQEKAALSDVQRVPLGNLDLEPERMQFKIGWGAGGATGSLAGVQVWNKNLEGVILAWRDPADGRLKVLNGHNRVAKAKELGVADIPVKIIEAKNAGEARAAGALQNMAEGHGRAVDVGKFLRDTQMSVEDLKKQGIPIRSDMMDKGIDLSRLTPDLFSKVISGEMSSELGAIIGRKLENPDLQTKLVQMLKGKSLTNKVVAELADIVANAPRTTTTQATLFGDVEMTESYAVQKAKLLSEVRTAIARDKTLFAKVAHHAERLGEVGIEIPVEEAAGLSKEAAQTLGVFDALKNKVGTIDNILNEASEKIGRGANARTETAEAVRRIKEALPGIIAGGPEPPRVPSAAGPAPAAPIAGPPEPPVKAEGPPEVKPEPTVKAEVPRGVPVPNRPGVYDIGPGMGGHNYNVVFPNGEQTTVTVSSKPGKPTLEARVTEEYRKRGLEPPAEFVEAPSEKIEKAPEPTVAPEGKIIEPEPKAKLLSDEAEGFLQNAKRDRDPVDAYHDAEMLKEIFARDTIKDIAGALDDPAVSYWAKAVIKHFMHVPIGHARTQIGLMAAELKQAMKDVFEKHGVTPEKPAPPVEPEGAVIAAFVNDYVKARTAGGMIFQGTITGKAGNNWLVQPDGATNTVEIPRSNVISIVKPFRAEPPVKAEGKQETLITPAEQDAQAELAQVDKEILDVERRIAQWKADKKGIPIVLNDELNRLRRIRMTAADKAREARMEAEAEREPAVVPESKVKPIEKEFPAEPAEITEKQHEEAARLIVAYHAGPNRNYAIAYRDWLAGRSIEKPIFKGEEYIRKTIEKNLQRIFERTAPAKLAPAEPKVQPPAGEQAAIQAERQARNWGLTLGRKEAREYAKKYIDWLTGKVPVAQKPLGRKIDFEKAQEIRMKVIEILGRTEPPGVAKIPTADTFSDGTSRYEPIPHARQVEHPRFASLPPEKQVTSLAVNELRNKLIEHLNKKHPTEVAHGLIRQLDSGAQMAGKTSAARLPYFAEHYVKAIAPKADPANVVQAATETAKEFLAKHKPQGPTVEGRYTKIELTADDVHNWETGYVQKKFPDLPEQQRKLIESASVRHHQKGTSAKEEAEKLNQIFRGGRVEEPRKKYPKAGAEQLDMFSVLSGEEPEPVVTPEAKATREDDELRADLGVSRENLAAYDPAASVYKAGRLWSYTTLGGGHAGTYDTKREALEAAIRHKQLKQEQFDNPSGFRDIVSVRARKRLALIEKYQNQGMTEMEAGKKALEEIPDTRQAEPEPAKEPAVVPETNAEAQIQRWQQELDQMQITPRWGETRRFRSDKAKIERREWLIKKLAEAKANLPKPAEPTVTIEGVAKGMAEAGERMKGEAAADLIRQGKGKARAGMKEIRGPLFGTEEATEQGGLFGEEPKTKEGEIEYHAVHEEKRKTKRGRKKATEEASKQLELFADQFAGKMEVSTAAPRRGFMSGSGVSTVGLAIARDIKKGPVDLRGHRIRNAEDLAALVQIFRDPRFETLRIFYLQGENLVDHEGFTSRMPNFVDFIPPGRTIHWFTQQVREKIARVGADSIYFVHNHPSGRPEPSSHDRSMTAEFGMVLPVKGHIVTDHGTYALIHPPERIYGQLQIGVSTHALTAVVGTPDPMKIPSVPHTLLGRNVMDPHALASMAIHLTQDPEAVNVVLLSAKHDVIGIQEVPWRQFIREKEFGDHMRGMATKYGSFIGAAVYSGKREEVIRAGKKHVENNTLLDTIYTGWGGTPKARPGYYETAAVFVRPKSELMFGRPLKSLEKSYRVREDSPVFDAPAPDYSRLLDHVKIEMPELVEMSQALNENKLPQLRRSLGKALGRFRHTEQESPDQIEQAEGLILLRRDLFAGPQIGNEYFDPRREELTPEEGFAEFEKKIREEHPEVPENEFIFRKEWLKRKKVYEFNAYHRDENFAPRVMAHELGHLVDWVEGDQGADKIMSRGNLLGRIAALKHYLKETLPGAPGGAPALSKEDRKKLQKEANKGVPKGMSKEERKRYIRERYAELRDEESEARALLVNKEVTDELKAVTKFWNPFDPLADDDYTNYRHSSKELYADTFSVLMNQPEAVKRMAPKFFEGLMNYLEVKPTVKELYEEMQARLHGGEADISAPRLERIAGMFKEGAERRAALNERRKAEVTDATSWLMRQLIDRGWEALKPMHALQKEPGDLTELGKRAQFDLEEIPYISAEAKHYLGQITREVRKALKARGLTDTDLGTLQMLRRVTTERIAIANPLGFSPTTAKATLEGLKEKLGEENFEQLQLLANKFQHLRDEFIISRAEASRIYSASFIQHMRDAANYVRFGVSHYLDKTFGPGATARIFKQVGTLSGIENPFIATVLQDLAVLRFAKMNESKLSLIDVMRSSRDPLFTPAEMRWSEDEGRRVPKEPANPRQALMTVIRDGQAEHVYISKRIADAYESQPFEATKIAEVWGDAMKWIRGALVTHNPIWMARNYPRDFLATVKNVPEVKLRNVPGLALLYGKSFKEAWRAVMQGTESPDIQTMERKRMLVPNRVWEAREQGVDNELERLAHEFSIDTGEAAEAVGARAKVEKVLDYINKWGRVSELTGKLAGFKYLQRRGTRSMQEIGHVVRSRVSTPDVKRRGEAQAITNNFAIFSNVGKEGTRSAWESFNEDRAGYIWKTIAINILPKLLLAAAGSGVVGEWYKRIIAGIPEYDKAQYGIVPVGLNSKGKSIYVRLPQDYEGQFFGALAWAAYKRQFFGKRGILHEAVEQIPWSPTKLNPMLKVAYDLFQYYGLDINPMDEWRGRQVIGDLAFQAKGLPAAKDLAKHVWKELGGSVLYNPGTGELVRVKNFMEKILQTFPGTIVGTFLKISDQGIADRLRDVSGEVRREKASETLAINKRITSSINKANKEKGGPDRGDMMQVWGELRSEGKIPRSTTSKEFSNRYFRWGARAEGNPYVQAIVNAPSNREKEALLAEYRSMMTTAEYEQVVGEILRARTQSPQSFREVERESYREPQVQPGR